MKTLELKSLPGIELVQPECEDGDLMGGYTSDLLSDVVANAPSGSVLITIQAHKNTVAVATLAGIRAIILCHNRPIPSDMLEAARQEKIALFRTPENQYTVSHQVHALLHGS